MGKKTIGSILLIVTIVLACTGIFITAGNFFKGNNAPEPSTKNYVEEGYYYTDYPFGNDGDIGFLGVTSSENVKYDVISSYDKLETYVDKTWSEYTSNIYTPDSSDTNEDFSDLKDSEDTENTYDEYLNLRLENIARAFMSKNYNRKYFEEYTLLLVEYGVFGQVLNEISLSDICISENILNIYIQEDSSGVVGGGEGTIFFISLPKSDMKTIKSINVEVNNTPRDSEFQLDKPIIYLYPEEETEVTIGLLKEENLSHTYPKYEGPWTVLAKPNGDLIDLKTGRELYALYWEGISKREPNLSEGFVISGYDTIPFLEEKLEILGLTQKEANEFIIYWLPKMENNKYNFIRFLNPDEINENMPLEVIPKPDTIIRVMMEFKPLDDIVEINEQILSSPTRKGFTLVEWGGTEIK